MNKIYKIIEEKMNYPAAELRGILLIKNHGNYSGVMADFIQLKIKIPRRARSTRRINGKGIEFKL